MEKEGVGMGKGRGRIRRGREDGVTKQRRGKKGK
jgi:hypothetical protein